MDLKQLAADSSFLESLLEWAKLAAVALGAFWAIVTFNRNNRIKAAEIILDIEGKFKKHIETLLQIEYSHDYEQRYKTAISKSLAEERIQFSACESASINRLEDALRHFYSCAYLKRLGVDAGTLDDACVYYLGILCSEKRPELLAYIQRFWPSIYLWSQLCKKPWPKRVVTHLKLMPQRVRAWWAGPSGNYAPRPHSSQLSVQQGVSLEGTTRENA